ncbi:hypothetical protein U1Q18_029116, partial [Sarracenia purpurea var. burkii]
MQKGRTRGRLSNPKPNSRCPSPPPPLCITGDCSSPRQPSAPSMAPCSDCCTRPSSGRVYHRRTQPILRPPRKPSIAVADHGTGIN